MSLSLLAQMHFDAAFQRGYAEAGIIIKARATRALFENGYSIDSVADIFKMSVEELLEFIIENIPDMTVS